MHLALIDINGKPISQVKTAKTLSLRVKETLSWSKQGELNIKGWPLVGPIKERTKSR